MDEPLPFTEIIDEAMSDIFGATGSWYYAELVRETRASRERIERDVRTQFQAVFAEVYTELTGFQMDPRTLEAAARVETDRRIQAEINRRIGEEERAFRDRVNRLCGWSQELKHKGCDGCGG